jgi:hypothetical protein
VAYEAEANAERGEKFVRLEDAMSDRARRNAGAGESYSDVILRLIEQEGA